MHVTYIFLVHNLFTLASLIEFALIAKIKELRSKDMCVSTHERASKALDECKKEIAEIFELIEKLKNFGPEQFLRMVANLDPKEKAIFSNFIERGEIYRKLQEIHKK